MGCYRSVFVFLIAYNKKLLDILDLSGVEDIISNRIYTHGALRPTKLSMKNNPTHGISQRGIDAPL
jgi:hypothetical protein